MDENIMHLHEGFCLPGTEILNFLWIRVRKSMRLINLLLIGDKKYAAFFTLTTYLGHLYSHR
jgi:hypothetical protein